MKNILKFKRAPYKRHRFFSAEKLLAVLFIASVAQYVSTGAVTWVTDSFRWVENTTRQLTKDSITSLEDAGESVTEFTDGLTTKVIGEKAATVSKPSLKETSTLTPDIPLSRVVKVVDGDTIHVRDGQGTRKIRLHGIDAPETSQPYGKAAGRKLDRLIGGGKVQVLSMDTDRYGRTVAKIYHGDRYIIEEMVRQGYAWWYERYARSEFKLRSAENEARNAKRGLWQDQDPVPPWEFRHR